MHWSCEWMAWCDQSINQSHGSSVWFMERVKLIFSRSYWIVASIVDKSKGKWAHRPRYFHSGLPTLPHVACVMCPIGTSWWWWWMLFISKPLTNGTLPLLWAFPTPQTNVGRLVKSIINYCKPRTLLFQQVFKIGVEMQKLRYAKVKIFLVFKYSHRSSLLHKIWYWVWLTVRGYMFLYCFIINVLSLPSTCVNVLWCPKNQFDHGCIIDSYSIA